MDAALASESQCVAFESVCHNGVIPRCCLGGKGSWEGRIPAERSPKTPDQAPFLLNFYGRSFLANFVSTSNLSVEHILWDTTAKKVPIFSPVSPRLAAKLQLGVIASASDRAPFGHVCWFFLGSPRIDPLRHWRRKVRRPPKGMAIWCNFPFIFGIPSGFVRVLGNLVWEIWGELTSIGSIQTGPFFFATWVHSV